jgi:ankyrin repeat domain-containing protein 50
MAPDLADIYKSTTAILFLGTPHRGSDLAQIAKTLGRIVAVAGFDTNTHNVKGLLPGSFELQSCHENFMRLYEKRGRNFKVRTFQEAKGMTSTSFLRLSGKV